MAMKPAGKAILIGLLTTGAVVAVYFSGILKSLPAAPQPTPQATAEPSPPAQKPAQQEVAEPARPAAPQPAPSESNSAFDALIRQSGNK